MNFTGYLNQSEDNEIFCLTNKDGIYIYETHDFQLLMKIDPFRIGILGKVYKPKIFYNSQLIAFIIEENKAFHSVHNIQINSKVYSLVLYDIKNFEIIGKITMRKSIIINDFLITKFFIILMIEDKQKVLLFKTSNLDFFKTISNVELGSITYCDDFAPSNKNMIKKDMCILAYKNSINNKIITLLQFIFNREKTEVLGVIVKNREIELNTNKLKYIGLLSSFLIVSSAFGNRVHIYDLISGKLKYCLILGNFPYEITELHLDNKKKIISIITNNKYLKLYKFNKLNKQCKCLSQKDENISMSERRGIFDKFKHKIGVNRNDFLCRYKINYTQNDMNNNMTIVYFDKKSNNSICIIQLNKNVKILQFDRKTTRDMIVMQEMTLPGHFIYKYNINNKNSLNENNNDNNINENNINDKNINNNIIINENNINDKNINDKYIKKNIIINENNEKNINDKYINNNIIINKNNINDINFNEEKEEDNKNIINIRYDIEEEKLDIKK